MIFFLRKYICPEFNLFLSICSLLMYMCFSVMISSFQNICIPCHIFSCKYLNSLSVFYVCKYLYSLSWYLLFVSTRILCNDFFSLKVHVFSVMSSSLYKNLSSQSHVFSLWVSITSIMNSTLLTCLKHILYHAFFSFKVHICHCHGFLSLEISVFPVMISSLSSLCKCLYNTALNDLRKKSFVWEKSEVFIKRNPVWNVIEKLAEHGIHCLPSFCINDVNNTLP